MNGRIQTRVRQPLGLIEVIDRSEPAIEEFPDREFCTDEHGVIHLAEMFSGGEPCYGGGYSLFTRIWLGLCPPTGAEPGYCAVVGEVFETGIPRSETLQARLRPVFLLDEAHDHILPRLLRTAANLKDIYCPYVDRADVAANVRRHDPYYQLLITPDEELLADVLRSHHGLCAYPYEEDMTDEQCRKKWPWWRSRWHVLPPVFPPHKEDAERTLRLVDALQHEKTEYGAEMFGVNEHFAKEWVNAQWTTPHMAAGMVVAAFHREDWVERVNVDAIHDGYPLPTEEEESEERLQRAAQDAEDEVILYTLLPQSARSVIEAQGMPGYRRMIGLPEEPGPEESERDVDRGGDEEGMVVPV